MRARDCQAARFAVERRAHELQIRSELPNRSAWAIGLPHTSHVTAPRGFSIVTNQFPILFHLLFVLALAYGIPIPPKLKHANP